MNQAKNEALSGFIVCLLFFTLFLQSGCMVVSALKGKPGLDTTAIKVGMSKAEVERILGSPVHDWVTSAGVVYRVYAYDAGVPPSMGDATGHVFMDGATLGVWELLGAIKEFPECRKREQMAVSYDVNGTVIGIFDHFADFEVLPADGRAEK
jgi:hypothetical protein